MELAEGFIVTKGYNAFSYNDISSELGIKNAAIHYYFPSKANLGTSIVKNNRQRFEEMVENMKIMKFDELKQLESFFKIYAKSNREQKICVIGSLGPDFNTLPEASQNELKTMTERIVQWLASILESGRQKGIFSFKGEAQYRALLVLSNMIASLQLSRILDKNEFKNIHQALLDDLKV
jgi:AcrR family transcriptional regulator